MPRIARSLTAKLTVSLGWLLVAGAAIATLALSSAYAATDASTNNTRELLTQVQACLSSIKSGSEKNCRALKDDKLLNDLNGLFRQKLDIESSNAQQAEAYLTGVAQHLRSILPDASAASVVLDVDSLDDIMSDYSFHDSDEKISLGTQFWQWVAKKLDSMGLQDRIDSFGESFAIDPNKRALIRKTLTWTMWIALAISLLFFCWALWRYVNPHWRRRRVDLDSMGSATGADRGNTPVMPMAQIRALPMNQQPSALLVACLDRLKGRELPDDVWKFTNSEIASTLKRKRSDVSSPMDQLIAVAELTIYGGRQASTDEIKVCFDAADNILATEVATA